MIAKITTAVSLTASMVFANATPSTGTVDITDYILFTVPAMGFHVSVKGFFAAVTFGIGIIAFRRATREIEDKDKKSSTNAEKATEAP